MTRRDPRRARGPSVHFVAGELVVRIADGELLEVVEVDVRLGRCRLEDGTWARPHDLEAPLRASYRWDLECGQRVEERRQAIERGDFDAVFPGLAEGRSRRRTINWSALGWLVATLEGVILIVLTASPG